MPTTRNVAVLVGSLRKGSYNRLVAKAPASLAGTELRLKIVKISLACAQACQNLATNLISTN